MKQRLFSLLAIALLGALFPPPVTAAASNGTLVKSTEQPAVYYVTGGKRYAFPNEKVFFSWYADFSSVVTISPAELASYPLAANVTSKPGVRLIKIQTDPKVYAVSRFGFLHWITTEAIAKSLYGANWNTMVDDVPDTFFTNYDVKEPITDASAYDRAAESSIASISFNMTTYNFVPDEDPTDANRTAPSIGGCRIFPDDNPWNQKVDALPVRPDSATFIGAIGANANLHPDFGGNGEYGIPYNVVPGTQTNVPITYTAYGDESDNGPFPIPANAKIEGNGSGDAHVIVLQRATCMLYELFGASKNVSGNGWSAESGAKWDLTSNALRPLGWTSADAAGLPILPGLVRYDEVAAGSVNHAIRFTAPRTQNGYILPATHFAGSNDSALPPMGLRVRLKAGYDISTFTGSAKIIAQAMKTYGMILADNGSSWFFQGDTDPRWNDDELSQLKQIPGSAFEAVQTGEINK